MEGKGAVESNPSVGVSTPNPCGCWQLCWHPEGSSLEMTLLMARWRVMENPGPW